MKKIKTHKGFLIYERTEKEVEKREKQGIATYQFEVYLPEQSPSTMDYPDWEAGTLQECISFIENY